MSAVLYDVPGPKAARRARIATVVGGLLVVAVLGGLVAVLASNEVFEAERWEPLQEGVVWEALLRALWNTVRAAAVAAVIAFVLAVVVTSLSQSSVGPVKALARTYVELFRGLPVLLMMIFAVIGLGVGSFAGVVIGLVLYNSAVFAEILRAGIVSLPRGQREAGLAIGLTPRQTFLSVELPQSLRRMLPSLVSQLVVLLKDTSLGYAIAYAELLRANRNLAQFYGNDTVFSFFFVTAAIYLAVNFALSRAAVWLDRRGSRRTEGQRVNAPEADAGA